jgi:hypothetical protein
VRGRSETAVVILALSGIVLSACSNTITPPSTTLAGHQAIYTQAVSELRSYLIAWHRAGPTAASHEYLAPSQQGGKIRLLHGSVTSYQPYSWSSAHRFTLLIGLDLRFSGSPGAWNVGHNDRYVTFTRSHAGVRYLMEFNTGL